MKLRTEIAISHFPEKINHQSRVLLLGSCFAENISRCLQNVKIEAINNPTGVLFNPASIYESICRFAEKRLLTRNELHRNDDIWFSYDFHSAYNDTDPHMAEERINTDIQLAHKALAQSDWVIITFGTAWVYTLNENGHIVANCHKQPASNFTRRRLSIEEIIEMYTKLMHGIFADKRVIFTVSPIRHLGDGASENFLSKSILKVAIAEIVERFDNAYYFPAYEILNDDLRDYRFYDTDLVHPSPMAIEYISEKFLASVLSEHTLEIVPQIVKIMKAVCHRPLNAQSNSYLQFCKQQIKSIEQLPEINLKNERLHFEEEITRWHENRQ